MKSMVNLLLLSAVVIFASVFLNRVSNKLGIPMLLAFILLGMGFGSDGLLKISFSDYHITEDICTVALIFIMFYGGFSTNWKQARPVAVKAGLLASLGVLITALLTGLCAHVVLNCSWPLSFLMGAVVSSTDAASVFSVLRSRKLNLRDNTASLLEMESGSNDPFAYMLTIIFIAMLQGENNQGFTWLMVLAQVGFGLVFGFAVAYAARFALRRFHFGDAGFTMVLIVGLALLAYALPTAVHGNGYLATYIAGIMLGNTRFKDKRVVSHFFDGLTSLMQIIIFFLLGLLSTPHKLLEVALPALGILLFLTFAARPVAVFALLAPFPGSSREQKYLVSFAGLRGAASIVFAILAVVGTETGEIVFHVTFFIVLVSILVQGSLLPLASRRLGMIDDSNDVLKTFTDYTDEVPVQFIQFHIPTGHPWVGKTLKEIAFPPETLVVLREHGRERNVPNGQTVLEEGNRLVLSAKRGSEVKGIQLSEVTVQAGDEYEGRALREIHLESDQLIIMIQRDSQVVIPQGDTMLKTGDVLVINRIEA